MYSTIRPEVELTLQKALTILTNEVRALEDTELDVKAYDNPAWAFKQAYKNGYKKAIRVVVTMLDQENKNERLANGGEQPGRTEELPTRTSRS